MALTASQRYLRDTASVGRDRETALLYDEAIAALRDAITAIARDDIEARCAAVRAATESITTLYLKLDVRRCGDTVDSLANIYGRILTHLLGINYYSDPAIARKAIDLLEPLRDPWTIPGGMVSACELAAGPARAANGAGAFGTTVATRRSAVARSPR